MKKEDHMVSVGYLGPEGTFSHQAAVALYGESASFYTGETIEDVFSMVENGVCEQGVVPVENSYEGSVNITMDLLYKYNIGVCGEFFMRIRLYLLAGAEQPGGIKRLYSHPMALDQCRAWLKDNMPGLPITEVASTSLAVKMAADDPEAVAIGSRLSGERHGLKTLYEHIEDDPYNITRFLVIGKDRVGPTGKDKTSILFSLLHKPGTLYRFLGGLAKRDINVTRIESRPMRRKRWEYLFFMDIEGHEKDPVLKEALMEMEGDCVFLKRLGSYPAGGDPWD
jgi:chorismate mutase/prephenate dehydratase